MSDDDLDRFRDPDLVNLQDYDALPENIDDPAVVDITESTEPNSEDGDDLDTGAATR